MYMVQWQYRTWKSLPRHKNLSNTEYLALKNPAHRQSSTQTITLTRIRMPNIAYFRDFRCNGYRGSDRHVHMYIHISFFKRFVTLIIIWIKILKKFCTKFYFRNKQSYIRLIVMLFIRQWWQRATLQEFLNQGVGSSTFKRRGRIHLGFGVFFFLFPLFVFKYIRWRHLSVFLCVYLSQNFPSSTIVS